MIYQFYVIGATLHDLGCMIRDEGVEADDGDVPRSAILSILKADGKQSADYLQDSGSINLLHVMGCTLHDLTRFFPAFVPPRYEDVADDFSAVRENPLLAMLILHSDTTDGWTRVLEQTCSHPLLRVNLFQLLSGNGRRILAIADSPRNAGRIVLLMTMDRKAEELFLEHDSRARAPRGLAPLLGACVQASNKTKEKLDLYSFIVSGRGTRRSDQDQVTSHPTFRAHRSRSLLLLDGTSKEASTSQ